MTWTQHPFKQCDACGRMTTRVHHVIAAGTDTTACDECFGYDATEYGEPIAEYLTVQQYEGRCCEHCNGWLYLNRHSFYECEDCGRTPSLCR